MDYNNCVFRSQKNIQIKLVRVISNDNKESDSLSRLIIYELKNTYYMYNVPVNSNKGWLMAYI